MILPRVIPCLLKKGKSLVKTRQYGKFQYVGDPINTIQIFNELEVDELVLLDIEATKANKRPDFDLLKEVAGECFMPLTYGGGIKSLSDMKKVFSLGVEKIIIGAEAVVNPVFIRKAADLFGSQSIVVSIDVRKNKNGNHIVCTQSGTIRSQLEPVRFARTMEQMGAGEILLNSVDCDGQMEGYDAKLISKVSKSINIPLIAGCGAGELKDLQTAYKSGAQAMAAGSLFVFQNKNRAVLVNFPSRAGLISLFKNKKRTAK